MFSKDAFKNKNILISGGAKGIGLSICKTFLNHGADIIILDNDQNALQEAKNLLSLKNNNIRTILCDLSKNNFEENVSHTLSKWRITLDVIINNARVPGRISFNDESNASFTQAFSIMVIAPFLLARSLSSYMKNSTNACIINISSVAGSFVSNESPSYMLAKSSLIHLSKILAVNLSDQNIRVNTLSPGFIVKDQYRQKFYSDRNISYKTLVDEVHLSRDVGTELDVANTCLYLASDLSNFLNGENIVLDGGLTIQDQWALLQRSRVNK